MKIFQRLLVGMDLSPMDNKLLAYLALLKPAVGKDVLFTHVSPELELPETQEEGEKMHPRQTFYADKMKTLVSSAFTPLPKGSQFIVEEGKVAKTLLQLEKSHKIDLTLLGMKTPEDGSGVSARSFIRKSKSSVLFIPETVNPSLRRILVATDFSEYSIEAMQKAIDLAHVLTPRPEVHALRIFDVPDDIHFEMDRTKEQFESLIRENVETAYRYFIRKVSRKGVKVHPHLVENRSYNSARHIMRQAKALDADMIVIGSQGHSFLSSYLLGSVTEKVLSYNKDLACLIVRKTP